MAQGSAWARRGRHLRGASRVAVAFGVVLLFAGLYLPALGPVPTVVGHATASGTGGGGNGPHPLVNVTVNMTDAPGYTPPYLSVPAGDTVNLTLVNQGQYNHTFTLLNPPNVVLNRSLTPTQLQSYFAKNGSQLNVSVAPGTTAHANLSFGSNVAGDSFEFVSVVPFQFEAGMLGFLNVTGAPTGPGQAANISTAVSALEFVPDEVQINVTTFPVTLDVAISNLGSNYHTWFLEGQPNYTLNSGNFSSYFTSHPPLASVSVPTSPGTVVWANFTVKAAGIYEYICTVPGHFANGMYGFLYVGVPAPAPPVVPSSAIVTPWVLYGGVGLLGVGGLLAAAALLVGRFPRAPPPSGH